MDLENTLRQNELSSKNTNTKNKNPPTVSHPTSNLNRETRGKFRGKEEQLRVQKDIFDLSANHSDYDIMNILKIPNSTYYRYKSKMYQEAKELWQQVVKESMEYRAMLLVDM